MNRMRVSLLSLMVVIILVGSGIVQDAEAEVRFSVTMRTPNVRVRVGNTPPINCRAVRVRRLPIRGRHFYRLSKRDRRVATRLAHYTGVPKHEILRLRSYGYQWFEIGRWLHLPRRIVRAAMHKGTWKRFLREERLMAEGGYYDRYDGRAVVYYIDD
jgi:hypothetical protein